MVYFDIPDKNRTVVMSDDGFFRTPPPTRATDEDTYSGPVDELGLRCCHGCQGWRLPHTQQTYRGQFLLDSEHGEGTYLFENGKVLYNGGFYTNALEGYGQVVYEDGTYFQGLFKAQRRFGPGVCTHTDGTQDVGLWEGKSLMRLARPVYQAWVPLIARSQQAKSRVLKHRILVPVCTTRKDEAYELLKSLGANERVLQQSQALYNPQIRNKHSTFFNRTLHDEDFFAEWDCAIEVAADPEEVLSLTLSQYSGPLANLGVLKEISSVDRSPKVEEESNSTNDPSPRICNICADNRQVRLEELQMRIQRVENDLHHIQETITNIKVYLNSFSVYPDAEAGYASSVEEQKSKRVGDERNDDDDVQGFVQTEAHSVDLFCEDAQWFWANANVAESKLSEALKQESELISKRNALTKVLEVWYGGNRANGEHEQSTNNSEFGEILKKKRVVVSDLLAWNNERIFVDMLKHCFLHRKSEYYVTVDVSKILGGQREQFQKAGHYEEGCVKFLKMCSQGDQVKAGQLMRTYQLNPDLCDGRGNTGVIYAVARDEVHVVKMLVNAGANLDVFNDEGLTPLTLVLLRYLAIWHNITNWESAFLNLCDDPKALKQRAAEEWNAFKSASTISNVSFTDASRNSYEVNVDTTMTMIDELKSCDKLHLQPSSTIFYPNPLDDLQRKLKLMQFCAQFVGFQEQYVNRTGEDQRYVFAVPCVKPPPAKKEKGNGKRGKGKEGKGKKKKEKKSGKKSRSSSPSSKSSKTSKKKSEKKSRSSSPSSKTSKSSKSSKSKKGIREKSTESNLEPSNVEDEPIATIETKSEAEIKAEEDRRNHLNVIYRTFVSLLNNGCDPNVGEMPLPPVILSVFTKNNDMLDDLLRNAADPNVATRDENLTCLHYLAMLPPCEEHVEMCRVLLEFSANPNARCNSDHWKEEKDAIIGKVVPSEDSVTCESDEGMTPLHALCMRYDFPMDADNNLHDIARMLVEKGTDVDDFYLGHTPLSLAVLRGNVKLVDAILATGKIDPNQRLGGKMGNLLTMMILKRYPNYWNEDVAREMYAVLAKHGGNPLNSVGEMGEVGNAVDFMRKEHEVAKKGATKKGKKGGKDKKKKRGDKSSKSSKSKKNRKNKGVDSVEAVKELLISCARDTLLRRVKVFITDYLYSFMTEDLSLDGYAESLAKFLTPEEAAHSLQLLIHAGKIKPIFLSPIDCELLLKFVEKVNASASLPRKVKNKKKKKTEKNKKRAGTEIESPTDESPRPLTIDELLQKMDYKPLKKKEHKYYLKEPAFDKDDLKYEVCFNCLSRIDKELILCPECEMIYFCSEQCNRESFNSEKHKCGIVFYNREQQRLKEEEEQQREEMGRLLAEGGTKMGSKKMPNKLQQKLEAVANRRQTKVQMIMLHQAMMEDILKAKKKNDRNKGHRQSLLPMVSFSNLAGVPTASDLKKGKRKKKSSYQRGDRESALLEGFMHYKADNRRGSTGSHSSGSGSNSPSGRRRRTSSTSSRGSYRQKSPSGKRRSTARSQESMTPRTSFNKRKSSKGFKLRFDSKVNLVQTGSAEKKLPAKNQYLLEKLGEYFPDFDVSALILPFACYSNGEFYYRFFGEKSVFVPQSYSRL